MAKKVKKSKKKKKTILKIDIDQILLRYRQLFLFDTINSTLANKINKELFVLDRLNNKPIILRINSGGGSLPAGFSIIDTIKCIKSPIITVVTGYAASMAGLIFLVGEQRIMFEHSVFMAHDVSAYNVDYVTKMLDSAEYLKSRQKQVFEFLSKHTKLSQTELVKAKNGELWLFANECKKKGICDTVII